MCTRNTFTNMCTQFQCHIITTCGEWLSDAKLLKYALYPFQAKNTLENAQVRTAPNCISVPEWAAWTTIDIHSKHAHVLHRPDLIIVGPSTWALFWVCIVRTPFLQFQLPRRQTGVFYLTLIKILLSSTHIGSATHVPHAQTFVVISRLADLWVLKCVPGFSLTTVSDYFQFLGWQRCSVLFFSRNQIVHMALCCHNHSLCPPSTTNTKTLTRSITKIIVFNK